MGWEATLSFAGRLAWFPVESLFSVYIGAWFNVGVDIAVVTVLSLPLVLRSAR